MKTVFCGHGSRREIVIGLVKKVKASTHRMKIGKEGINL